MNLSDRLSLVSNMVIACDTACDIGCDHGYVSIDLCRRGVAKKVIACDINKGPLLQADANIAAAGFRDVIETRLSDGLHNVTKEDAPEVVIAAGMGGRLMTKILEEGRHACKSVKQFVLQPQSELFLVRGWLRENGYKIVREDMVLDAGKYYFVMDARVGESPVYEPKLQKLFDTYSEYLINTKNPVLKEYLKHGLEVNKTYLSSMDQSKGALLMETNRLIESALSMME